MFSLISQKDVAAICGRRALGSCQPFFLLAFHGGASVLAPVWRDCVQAEALPRDVGHSFIARYASCRRGLSS